MAKMPASVEHNLFSGMFTGDSIKESVMNLIYQITPEDTPFYNITGNKEATNVKHEWLTRALDSRAFADSTAPEGDQWVLTDMRQVTRPSRVSNTCHIFREIARVSESMAAVQHHGISDFLADQLDVAATVYKYNIENAMWLSTEATGAATVNATGASTRQLKGALPATETSSYIATNRTDNAAAQLTETQLNDDSETLWSAGARPQDLFCGPKVKRKISTFTGSATKFMPHDNRKAINTISVYETDFHTILMHLSRDILQGADNHAYVLFDRSFFSKAWLRPTFIERLPRSGGDFKIRVEGEMTVEYGNEAAAALRYDIGTPTGI